MMYSEAKIYVAFGEGTVSVGAFKASDALWAITIRELKDKHDIGSTITNDELLPNSSEVIMSFPTENQMLKAMAVFTNRTFEEMIDKWNEIKFKKDIDTDKQSV